MLPLIAYIFIIWLNRKNSIFDRCVWPIAGALVVWFFTSGPAGSFLSTCESGYATREVPSAVWDIRSMRADNRYSGSFFLGTGSISSTDYYYTMTRMGADRWLKQRVLATGTFLRETTSPPRLTRWTVHKTAEPWLTYVFPGINLFMEKSEYYVFDVPAGTIVESYSPM